VPHGQTLTDGRIAPFSYITHAAMQALHRYFERAQEAKLSTGIALYMGIAYLLSIEKRDGRREGGIEKTREEIGEAGGLSATNVTRYAEHLVSAEVLALEQQLAGGANLYLWRLVEPPHQGGEAVEAPLHGGDTPHQGGEAPLHGGEAYIDRRSTKKTTEETPCSPPAGDSDAVHPIFDFWRVATGRNASTKFSPKRQRAIRARLKEGWTPEQLRRAIAGCAGSDWHMKRGRWANREGGPKTDLTLILADAEHVEDFAGRPAAPELTAAAAGASPVLESEKAAAAWEAAKQLLCEQLEKSTFGTWIAPLEVAGEREDKLVLIDTSAHGVGAWVNGRYRALVLEALDGFDDMEIVDEKQLEIEAA
jgi:hypothetical protein